MCGILSPGQINLDELYHCRSTTEALRSFLRIVEQLARFADHASRQTPAVERLVRKVLEDTPGLARLLERLLGLRQCLRNLRNESLILG